MSGSLEPKNSIYSWYWFRYLEINDHEDTVCVRARVCARAHVCVRVWSCISCKCPDERKMGLLSGLKKCSVWPTGLLVLSRSTALMEHDSSLVP